MKKNLLLTTALVAFSMPAFAGIYDGEIIEGHNTRAEGGVCKITDGNSLTVENATFKNNIATSVGGALAVGTTGDNSLTLKNTNFYNNHATYDGGAVGTYKGLIIEGGIFEGNTAQLTGDNWDQSVDDDKPVGGGALSLGAESVTKVSSISGAQFNKNKSGKNGGAIGTRLGAHANNSAAKLDIEASFTGNQALDNGGAIYNTFYADNGLDKGQGVTVKGTFTSNTAGNSGGAIYNDGAADVAGNNGGVMTVSDSTFTGNSAEVWGGAIYSGGKSSLTVKNSTFKENTAGYAGALGAGTNTLKTAIENTVFENNSALEIGAVGLFGADSSLKNVKFIGNKATSTDASSDGAGALFLGAVSTTSVDGVISESYFEANASGTRGGAISTRSWYLGDNTNAKLDINNTKFVGNTAKTEGGAFDNYFYNSSKGSFVYVGNSEFEDNSAANGGAIYNHGSTSKQLSDNPKTSNNPLKQVASIEIADSTFTGNTASSLGGAIYNELGGTVKLSGTNTFSGNTAAGEANDIHNLGNLIVQDSLTLDGGITGSGDITFNNVDLTATLDTTKIAANTVTINDSTLNLILTGNVAEGEHDFISATTQEGVFDVIENNLYDIEHLSSGKINVTVKDASELADNLGLNSSVANVLGAATSGGSTGNAAFDTVASALKTAAQTGDTSILNEVSKLGTDANPIVASQEAAAHDVLFSVVNNELNGDTGSIAGMSSGDYFKKATAWIRGLFNKADHESTSKSSGFNSDTYGVAMGVDSEINENTRLGFGYANSQTDIEAEGRDTDVDTNSLFVYAKYQPRDWYINTVLAYSWSDYEEKKSVLGTNAGAKYDVDTIALQSMYGYEIKFKEYDLTPEFGFRYLHTEQDAYKDKLGTTVGSNQEDILTAVLGAKVAKNYTLENGTVLRPELKASVTYDLFDSDNSANILLANGASYTVDGEKLNRLGFELGAKVTTFATEKTELSAGYLTRLREDYQDHTITFDVKYNF